MTQVNYTTPLGQYKTNTIHKPLTLGHVIQYKPPSPDVTYTNAPLPTV